MIPSLTSENAKTASVVRDRDVGAGDEPGAAAEGVALDPRDDGRGAAFDRLQHPAQGVGIGDVALVVEVDGRAHPLDVRACAEARAVTGQEHRAGLADVDECLGELGDQGCIEGVPALGRASVTRRMSPSRSIRSALIAGTLWCRRGRKALHRRARARRQDRNDVPRAVRPRGGVRTGAAAGTRRDPRTRMADDAGRLRRRRAHRRQPDREGGDRGRRRRAGRGDDGARHGAAQGGGAGDLHEALARDRDAAQAFEGMSFTHRREYVEWIEEAKRPETRARRVATTVERVRAGQAQR